MRQKSDLRGYQQRTVTHLYENDAVQAVLPMGAGKTACALTAIKELIDDKVIRCAVVFAPKRVAQLVWPKEPLEWAHLKDMRISLVAGTADERVAALRQEADIYVVGIDNAQWLLETLADWGEAADCLLDLLVIDESSKLKSPKSKRLKALRRSANPQWRMRWLLTGTPRPNGYEDQWGPLTYATRDKLWGRSFYKWRDERFVAQDYMRRKWAIRSDWERRTVDDINSVSITIDPSDMPDLPELVSLQHFVQLPQDVMSVYDRMERELFAKHGNKPAVLAANAAVATGKLSQIAQGFLYEEGGNATVQHLHSVKADLLVEMVENLNGLPTLIAYDFIEDLRILRSMWPGLPYLGAGVSDKNAEKHEAAWNRAELPLLAVHPAAAGHGLNLQFGGSQLIMYGMTWSAEM